jgi:photosystem II stability/assembly factor-like uncharacterized protein
MQPTLSSRRSLLHLCVAMVLLAIVFAPPSKGQEPDTGRLPGLQWRLIGPFRAGRVTAVAGVVGDPSTYYFGTPGGGAWKTSDGGQVWKPIFDKERVASIGALAVAPSDPRVVYLGTGEQTRGHGLYRSSDGGATWKSAGLEDLLFIQAIVVDPHDPNVVIVGGNSLGIGMLWRPLPRWADTANRGIFKTTDGGASWQKVFGDHNSAGVVDMCSDPSDPRVLYAVVYHTSSASGESKTEATSEIVKSSDEGSTWAPLQSKGLPEKARKRMGVTVAAGTGGRRLYAILDQGFFRSDDGGANWQQSTKDPRVVGNEYFSRVFADPNRPDVIYVSQTSMYRSVDGGKTFEAFAGAPSGDDFHVAWIDPRDSQRMIFGVDQGAIISVNGGNTWSSWYNQPTGQFYHVSTDNLFPYRVYAAQQDSGTAGVASRSDYGEILAQDWYSAGGFEYAFIAPDPVHPSLVYSGGWYGSVVRLDKTTGQIATVFERGQKYRVPHMAPLVFSPQTPSVLYLGTQFVLKTSDGAMNWQEISPDLTGYVEKEEPEGKVELDKPRPPGITSLSPSPVKDSEIWAGTSNRLVYITRDAGATWKNVSPPGLAEPVEILYAEASHHDPATAYLTVGAIRESTPPYVARTHDYGATWEKVVNGFPDDEMVRVVREDPKRKGLLYAGTDTGVFISWDDGDHWQSLSLNLPATPVTDLDVHGNDLVISTFGRGLWILDNISPLRDIKAGLSADVRLFPPATGVLVRWDNYQDTPYPVETPAGQNPPDGAMIDYFLKTTTSDDLTLTIYDEKGGRIAVFTNKANEDEFAPANVPDYWFAPQTKVPKLSGMNRFVWELRYPPPASLPYSYYGELLEYTEYTLADHAIPGLTPRQMLRGPRIVPGKYSVELRYGGQTLRQPLTVELDPRVHASFQDLVQQRDLGLKIARGMQSSYGSYGQVAALRKALTEHKELLQSGDAGTKDVVERINKEIEELEKGTKTAPGFGPVNRDLGRLLFSVENADLRPAQTLLTAVQQLCDVLSNDSMKWQQLNEQEISVLNAKASSGKAPALPQIAVTTNGCKE